MCGRYYVDDDTAREIEKVIRQVDEKLRREAGCSVTVRAKDIHPTDIAPVLAVSNGKLCCKLQRWGFPKLQESSGSQGKQVIFNARSESASEKKMFRESVEHRRVIIPATWFYEWNRNKEKYTFYRKDRTVLFMAGFYSRFGTEERFVILTTEANESMKPVHDRMPLILEEEEIVPWIFDKGQTEAFLHKNPCQLERRAEFEQMSLFG